MKSSNFKILAIAASLLGLAMPGLSAAKGIIGYAVDGSGTVVRDGVGKCLQTGSWTKERMIEACGKPAAKKPADTDGDGVTDDMDKCPDTPSGVKVDDTGCPIDSDGDGVADYLDKCPNTPAGAAVDASGCPLDSDGDGIADYLDKCPNTAKGTKVDNSGCPLKAIIELRGVNFANNKAVLKPESKTVLDEMAVILKRYPDMKVEVAGHTDTSGSRALNVSLSQRRAEAVRTYLIEHGANADSLTAKGYAYDKPVASNATREGRARNRRVELVILK